MTLNPQPPGSSIPGQNLGTAYFLDLIPDMVLRAEPFRTSCDIMDEEILRVFAEQMRLIIRALYGAVEDNDADRIRRQAHSLQGMGGTAGVPEISVVGEELSQLAKQGHFEQCRHLITRLDRWQGDWDATSSAGGVSNMRKTPILSGRVLIVDDELPNRLYLRKLLSDHGATVIEAENGSRALELAQQQAPDLALVDVVMPGISGYEVCQKLVTTPATCHVSVIMVTARSTVEDIEHAFILGVFDYIRKPFHPRELLARVHNALQLKRQGDELRKWQARMIRELDAAGALQRKLLPTEPFFNEIAEVRFAYQSSMSVGGDVFSAFSLPNGNLCAYVGDVAGHGVGSALVSTLIKVLIEEVTHDYFDRGPAVICNQIHHRFSRYVTNPELFATLFLAILDPQGNCTAFNCGHPAPLLFDAHGHALQLFEDRGGMPIGLSLQADVDPYLVSDEVSSVLPAGAVMAIFSDGLLEARQSASAKPCGEETLGTLLAQTIGDPDHLDVAQAVMKRLGVLDYQLDRDDCTLVVVARHDPAEHLLHRSIAVSHKEVAGLASEVQRVLRGKGWSEEAAGAVQLLVMEHGANIVDHAHAQLDSLITLQLRLSDGQAFLLFRDFGREWNFQTKLESSLNQEVDSPRGRGLQIIRTIAKHIDIARHNRQNVVRFVVSSSFEVLAMDDNRSVSHE
jgi:CheY-like chemotaxis protein/anti-sigma regulatory factor (Ser/Thr protein kinase)